MITNRKVILKGLTHLISFDILLTDNHLVNVIVAAAVVWLLLCGVVVIGIGVYVRKKRMKGPSDHPRQHSLPLPSRL